MNGFAARVIRDEGYSLTKTMPIEELLESIKKAMPVDVIYRVKINADYTVEYEPCGIISMSYKPIEENLNGDNRDPPSNTAGKADDVSTSNGGDGVQPKTRKRRKESA